MKFILILTILTNITFAGELVVMLGKMDNGSQDLKANYLEKIKSIASTKKVEIKVVEIDDKAPKDLKFLPAIYFQDHKGRSLFLGRYNNLQKIEKFVQTKKLIHSAPLSSEINQAVILKNGNFKLFIRIKITDLSGDIPSNFDQANFKSQALKLIKGSFLTLENREKTKQVTGDRTIYFDIYPYKDTTNKLSLATAIYSQFDCHSPIAQSLNPVQGPFDQMDALFNNITQNFEATLLNLLSSSTKGDAIDFNLKQTRVTWKSLGLDLPKKPADTIDIDPATLKTGTSWTYSKNTNDNISPAVFFNFPAPLDHYEGQIKSSESLLSLPAIKVFKNVSGTGSVNINSLDMGNQHLNESAISSINAKDPIAKLTFESLNFIDQSIETLRFGEIFPIIGKGSLFMKGKKQDVSILGDAGLVINDDGEPRLFINMKFRVNINKAFGVSGPDSSTESNDLMDYNIVMEMKPTL